MARELFYEPFTKYIFYADSERIINSIKALNNKFHEQNQLYLIDYMEEIEKELPFPVRINRFLVSEMKWSLDTKNGKKCKEYEPLTVTTEQMFDENMPVRVIHFDKENLRWEVV